ncbi:MAG TPA: DUF4405 domain-containing protein [Pseudomonadales bacterium]|nr:DUF4405 domain-containing protein [Pseudomonadales bacterium]
MLIKREWATPLTMGAFLLMAVTGILMFFHLDRGLAKDAHEWLGWALVSGVAAHVTVNWVAFKRYFLHGYGRWIVLVFALITGAALLAPEEEEEGGNPASRITQMVVSAPLSDVASFMKKDSAEVINALRAKGYQVSGAEQSIRQIAGEKRGDQFRALAVLWGD